MFLNLLIRSVLFPTCRGPVISTAGKAAKDLNLNGSGLGMGLIRKALTINGGKIEVIPGREKIKKSGIDYGDNLFKITIPKDKK